jgi:hypothetical protein
MSDCILSDYRSYLFASILLILEAWLGKTEKTKYSSILDVIIFGSISIVIYLITRRKKDEGR